MARILYAWEMGGGLGHTATLADLAEHPRLAGHEAILAVPWLFPAAEILSGRAIRVLQAPVFPSFLSHRITNGRPFRAGSFTDILACRGYADSALFRPLLAAWQNLLEVVRPDLVIVDHAPTLVLAARGRAPAIVVGSAFTIPPAHLDAFPAYPAPSGGLRVTQLASEQCVHAVLTSALSGAGPPARSLPAWFEADARIPLTYPLIDPYDGIRRERGVGPARAITGPPVPPQPHIFAYLAPDYPALGPLVDALAATGVTVTAYARGIGPAANSELRRRGLDARDRPVDLAAELARASLIVHHGSLGVAQAALAMGRPHVVFPHDLEKEITTALLARLGVAMVAGHGDPASFIRVLPHALTDAEMPAAARRVAEQLRLECWRGADAVADAAETLLAS